MKHLLNIIMILIIAAGSLPAQDRPEIKAGADLVSRYMWRGFDIGSAPSLQPALSGSYKGLSVGVWGAYTLSSESSGVDEIDGWLSYTISLKGFAISALVTDYYYPNLGGEATDSQNDLFNYADSGGAHILEAGLQVSGPAAFPVKLSGQIPLGENFTLPLFIRLIVNPAIEKAYLIGGISL